MNMQNVSNLVIPEGDVRTIHDSDGNLLWGKLSYDTKYMGDSSQSGSPSPSSPQTVNVVTGTQAVTVNGKNLFDRANAVENMILGWASANDVTENGSLLAHEYMLVSEGDTFASNYGMCVFFYDSNDDYLGCLLSGGTTIGKQTGTYVRTFAVPSGYGITKMKVEYRHNQGGNPNDMTSVTDIMLNVGSSVLPYEPYQSYTVDLGNIELCKIGDYQDYIYKNGDDWYVHKDIGKTIVDGTENWTSQTSNTGYMYRLTLSGVASNPAAQVANLRSDYFTPSNGQQIYNVTTGGYMAQLTVANYVRFNIGDTTDKLADFKNWLSANRPVLYYALATPTDTQITDTTLIAQLNAIHQFLTRYGYNATVSGNLPMIIDKTNL